jgi:chromosomal replication initiator protein
VETKQSTSRWDAFQHQVALAIPDAACQTWILPLDVTVEGNRLHLTAPTEFHAHWVRDRYLDIISAAAAAAYDTVGVIVKAAPATETPPPVGAMQSDPSPSPTDTAVAAPSPSGSPQQHDHRLITKYNFDNFVVGQSNRFAHAAAMAVAEQPGKQYNPLFIYGPAGLGKTHLLHAVGHHRRELDSSAVIRYITSEQFFNEFINGIRRKRMDEFKARYRTTDILLLDDVQFFEGKEQILEEFFHTFNTLYEAGKQMVISSDRHPKNLASLEARLRSRFEWGLLTDIQPPDVETRLAILRKNAEYAPTSVPTEVLGFIAENVLDNIRELEGALTRVAAFAALTHERVTLDMAKEVLSDLAPQYSNRKLTADSIIELVCNYFGLTVLEMIGPSRKQPLALSRQIAMYLCRELTDLSLPKIGTAFGGRDHTTVLHAVDKVKGLIVSDKSVFDEITTLSQKLRKS